jgi:hypothetical protein
MFFLNRDCVESRWLFGRHLATGRVLLCLLLWLSLDLINVAGEFYMICRYLVVQSPVFQAHVSGYMSSEYAERIIISDTRGCWYFFLAIQGMNDEMFSKCFEAGSRAMSASWKLDPALHAIHVCQHWGNIGQNEHIWLVVWNIFYFP